MSGFHGSKRCPSILNALSLDHAFSPFGGTASTGFSVAFAANIFAANQRGSHRVTIDRSAACAIGFTGKLYVAMRAALVWRYPPKRMRH